MDFPHFFTESELEELVRARLQHEAKRLALALREAASKEKQRLQAEQGGRPTVRQRGYLEGLERAAKIVGGIQVT